jgi:transposase
VTFGRIGIEAGPLSQWLVNALTAVELPVTCVETRHMKALLTAQQINKTDRNDARGIAHMMRVGLFKPVHVKTLAAQEQRMLLTSRKLLQRKLLDEESGDLLHAARDKVRQLLQERSSAESTPDQ